MGLKLLQRRARVAASFCRAPMVGELANLRKQGLEVAEVRLDLAGIDNPPSAAELMQHFAKVPTIATLRGIGEGGKWRGSAKARHAIIKAALQYADAADIELAAGNARAITKTAHALGKTIILSRHNFAGIDTIQTMHTLAKKVFNKTNNATKTGDVITGNAIKDSDVILKIAGRVRNRKDLQVLEDFLRQWRHYPIVVIGMGESQSALTSRRKFPHTGSKLAFAAIDKKTAPGQLTLPQTKTACRQI